MHGPCGCVWDWGLFPYILYVFKPERSELECGLVTPISCSDHLLLSVLSKTRNLVSHSAGSLQTTSIVQYDSPGGGWHYLCLDLH